MTRHTNDALDSVERVPDEGYARALRDLAGRIDGLHPGAARHLNQLAMGLSAVDADIRS